MNTALTRCYCEDCKFCAAPEGMKFAKCHAPQNVLSSSGDDLVSRSLEKKTQWRIEYCSSHRGNIGTQICGPDAAWFEPKDVEQVAA